MTDFFLTIREGIVAWKAAGSPPSLCVLSHSHSRARFQGIPPSLPVFHLCLIRALAITQTWPVEEHDFISE